MVLSWLIGRKKYPVHYDMRSILKYVVMALVYYFLYTELGARMSADWMRMAFGTVLLASYCYLAWKDIKPSIK